MKYITGILVPIFLFVAIFGFALMCHEVSAMDHGHMVETTTPCILDFMGTCASDGIAMAIQHISASQNFSNSLISSFFILTISLIFVSFLYVYQNLLGNIFVLAPHYISRKERWRETTYTDIFLKKKITHWLSHFNQSPSSY